MKILSFDPGLRTFNYCIQDIVLCNKEMLMNEIDILIELVNVQFNKIIERTLNSELKEQKLIDSVDALVNKTLKRIDKLLYIYKSIGKKTIKLTDWVFKDLFPIPEILDTLICDKCKQKSKWYISDKKVTRATTSDKVLHGLCTRHFNLLPTGKSAYKSIEKQDIKKMPLQQIIRRIIEELHNHPEFLDVNHVIIEKQKVRNGQKRIEKVETVLNSYFVDHGILNKDSLISVVQVIHAKHKLTIEYDGPTIDTSHIKGKKKSADYRKRKYTGVEMSKYILEKECDIDNLEYLMSVGSKKDDLCDNYLMCRWYIEHNGYLK